jgi:hypothetical protein
MSTSTGSAWSRSRPTCRCSGSTRTTRSTAPARRNTTPSSRLIASAHERGQPCWSARPPSRSPRSAAQEGWLNEGPGPAANGDYDTNAKARIFVLNARYHEQEARSSRRPALGAVTIATNMAGRGTDIQLGGNADMQDHGRHGDARGDPDARRAKIEAESRAEEEGAGRRRPLRDRHRAPRKPPHRQPAARPFRPSGRPGPLQVLPVAEDDLMRIFGSERMDGMLQKLGLKEGEAIVHPWINKALEKAQQKVEARNFDIRKNLLKFDDVMNDQRKVVFAQRHRADGRRGDRRDRRRHASRRDRDLVASHIPEKAYPEQWDTEGLQEAVRKYLNLDLPIGLGRRGRHRRGRGRERLNEDGRRGHGPKGRQFGPDIMRQVEKAVLLQTLRPAVARASGQRSTICARSSASAATASAIRCRNTRPRPSAVRGDAGTTAPNHDSPAASRRVSDRTAAGNAADAGDA